LPGLIGFGGSQQALTALDGTIDTSELTNYAFSMPREGTITALAGYLSVTVGVSLGEPITVRLQIYESTTPDDIFSPITDAEVTFTLPASITAGDTFNAIVTDLEIPVAAQTRLLLVASAEGPTLGGTVTGYFSAGLMIS